MAEKENFKCSTNKDKVYKCKVCHNKWLNAESYVVHLESKEHRKELLKEKYGKKYLEAKAKLDNSPRIMEFSVEKQLKEPLEQEQDSSEKGNASSSTDDSSEDEAEVFTCQLCRMICTGFITYQMHLKGKKHQKALNKAELLKKLKEHNLIPKSATSKEQSESDISRFKAEYASQDIECGICQKKCSGLESYKQHCQRSAHQKKVAIKHMMDEMTSEKGLQLLHGEGSPFARCEVCQKNFSGLLPYQQHMSGIFHQKQAKNVKELSKIKDLMINDEGDLKKLICKECGKSFSGPVPFSAHLQSSVHAKLKEKTSQIETLMKNHPELVKIPSNLEDSEDSDGNNDPEDFLLTCKVCHMVFSGPSAARDHIESSKHMKTVKKAAFFYKLLKGQVKVKGLQGSALLVQKKLIKAIRSKYDDSSDSEFDIIEGEL